jgi:sulfur carrier protein ThiS
LETISKKVVSIEFGGKKYVLSDEMTIENFLSSLGFDDNEHVLLRPTRDGFALTLK